jgi:hypothetical protein
LVRLIGEPWRRDWRSRSRLESLAPRANLPPTRAAPAIMPPSRSLLPAALAATLLAAAFLPRAAFADDATKSVADPGAPSAATVGTDASPSAAKADSSSETTPMPDAPPAPADWRDFDRLWDYNDPAATEARFRALLPEAEASADTGKLAELLSQIARTHSLRGQFDAAHPLLDRAESLLAAGESSRARVRILLERGPLLQLGGGETAGAPALPRSVRRRAGAGRGVARHRRGAHDGGSSSRRQASNWRGR